MTAPYISTPKGFVTTNRDNKAELVWNTDFQQKWATQYSDAQKFVDSEVLSGCEPFTPLLTGVLIMTGILSTEIGSGVVSWITPYAHRQYYSPREPGSQTGPLRGPFWFERWKEVGGPAVIEGARRIAGGGK